MKKRIIDLRLPHLSKADLEDRQMNFLKGGQNCGCACSVFANLGVAVTSEGTFDAGNNACACAYGTANANANESYGYGESGGGGNCACACNDEAGDTMTIANRANG